MNEQDYRNLFHQVNPDPGVVDALCARSAPRRKKGLRPVLAAALCAALVLSVTNYSAIAAGVQQVLGYVAGIGAVAEPDGLLVQAEPIRWDIEEEQETWLIENALLRDGVLYVQAAALSKRPAEHVHQSGNRQAQLKLEVYVDGTPLQSVFFAVDGKTYPSNYTQHSTFTNFGDSDTANVDYYWEQRFASEGYQSYADFMQWSFQVPEEWEEGPFEIRLSEYQVPESFTYTDTLEMARPELLNRIQSTREIGEGTATVLVSADGRSAALYGELNPEKVEENEYLVQIMADHGIDFVDEAGNRYPGTVRPLNYGNSFMPEYCLLQEPEEPIVRVEISDIRYNIGSGSLGDQRFPSYTNLNWVIELPAK